MNFPGWCCKEEITPCLGWCGLSLPGESNPHWFPPPDYGTPLPFSVSSGLGIPQWSWDTTLPGEGDPLLQYSFSSQLSTYPWELTLPMSPPVFPPCFLFSVFQIRYSSTDLSSQLLYCLVRSWKQKDGVSSYLATILESVCLKLTLINKVVQLVLRRVRHISVLFPTQVLCILELPFLQ